MSLLQPLSRRLLRSVFGNGPYVEGWPQYATQMMIDQGFHLDNTLMSKLMRTFIYYVEEIQLHNLGAPSRPLKSAPEGYVKAWEQHPHGDHDDTPPEWREYK